LLVSQNISTRSKVLLSISAVQ